MQIIFQDPVGSLNPRMPVSDIIGEGLVAQADTENDWGNRKVRDERVGDYLEIVGLRRDYARRYPARVQRRPAPADRHRARPGARRRSSSSATSRCRRSTCPSRSQILNLLLDLRREFGLTYLFIAHNLSVVQYISDRVGVMYLGQIVELAPVGQLYADPRHPYTVALLSAIPDADPRRRKRRIVLKGDVPSPAAPPSGCRFHTRCWLRTQLGDPEVCSTDEPVLRDIGNSQQVACHFAERISPELIQVAAGQQDTIATADIGEDEGTGPTDGMVDPHEQQEMPDTALPRA